MSQADRLGAALRRIASLTSIHRTRVEDTRRIELRGGTTPELRDRLEATIVRLERVAGELEKGL